MNDIFIKRFETLLENSNMSQKQIALELKVSAQHISNWKKGFSRPSYEDLINIAKLFKVKTDYLLGLEDEFGKPQTQEKTEKIYIKKAKITENINLFYFFHYFQ